MGPRATTSQICKRCGKGSHPRQQCPAKDVTCFRCERKGHFAALCLSKTVAQLTTGMNELLVEPEEDPYLDAVYLNTVEGAEATMWSVQIGRRKDTAFQSGYRGRINCNIEFDMEGSQTFNATHSEEPTTLRSRPQPP